MAASAESILLLTRTHGYEKGCSHSRERAAAPMVFDLDEALERDPTDPFVALVGHE